MTDPKGPGKALTAPQVAKITGLGLKTIDKYCREGLFPGAYKVARDWRIPEEDLGLPRRKPGRPKGK